MMAFRDTFSRRTRRCSSAIRVPKLKLCEPDDYYVWYVLVLGIPEDLFWSADVSLLRDVAESKNVFDKWESGEREHAAKRSS